MDYLHHRVVYPLTQSTAERFEDVDTRIEQFVEDAEEQCRKLKTGEVAWSPVYKRVCLVLLYWYKRKYYALGLQKMLDNC